MNLSQAWHIEKLSSITDWAEKNRFLSSEDSSEPGVYRAMRAPYQREIQDSILNCPEVCLMTSAQIGKTLMLLNILGYFLALKPAPTLVIMPTIELGLTFSKDRLAPMIRDCPPLTNVTFDSIKTSSNTLLRKTINSVPVSIAGANSPVSLSSRPVQYLFLDEVDRFPSDCSGEGDPVALARKRQATFWDRKTIFTSTPTTKGSSRIESLFEYSDKSHYYVKFPCCNHAQTLDFDRIFYIGKGTKDFKLGHDDLLGISCVNCGELISENHKNELVINGFWKAHNPEFSSIRRGFHLNELYSFWRSWREIALDYEESKNDENLLQAFTNVCLGLPFNRDELVEELRFEKLLERAENSDYSMGQIPKEALFLTCAVDVAKERQDLMLVAWGAYEQAWIIDYQIINGSMDSLETWEQVELYSQKTWQHPLGKQLRIRKLLVDTGLNATSIYPEFSRKGRSNWVAIKGRQGFTQKIISSKTSVEVNQRGSNSKQGVKLHIVGSDVCKRTALSRLNIKESGAKYINFPNDIDPEIIRSICESETLVTRLKNGVPTLSFKRDRSIANEGLDLLGYNLAANNLAGGHRIDSDMSQKFLEKLTIDGSEKFEVSKIENPVRKTNRKPRQDIRDSWLNRY